MAVLQVDVNGEGNAGQKMETKKRKQPKIPKEAFLVAQDIKFAKVLASNSPKIRDRALKSIKKWFQSRSVAFPFTEDDFMRIWKGLFYSMWMSDKPLIQEECAENISQLVHLQDLEASMQFFKCGLRTLCQEWFGIDQLRLNKFMMFLRRLLRQGLVVLKNNRFKSNAVAKFCKVLSETILDTESNVPLGLNMHFTEIYLEELAKVSEGKIHPSLVTQFVLPFVKNLAISKDGRQISHIKQFIFHYLLKQSEAGIAFEEKFDAWRSMGFPGGSIDAVVKEKVDEDLSENEDEHEETPTSSSSSGKELDPRAGKVDVELPQLKFSSKEIVKSLQEHKFVQGSNTKSKKAISQLIREFSEMAKGRYPFGIKRINLPKDDKDRSTKLKTSVNRLVKFEEKLKSKKRKIKDKTEKIDAEEERPPKRKRKNVANEDDHDFFRNRLDEIFRMEAKKIKKAKRKTKNKNAEHKRYEYSFRRNSGTWFVYDEDKTKKTVDEFTEEPQKVVASPDKKGNAVEVLASPEKPESPSLSNPKVEENPGPSNEWDRPPQDGETEIFVPVRKRRSLKAVNKNFDKNFKSPSAESLVKNPFSKMTSTPKKVKIDLKLNKSQEFHEHHAQILSSPAIPFDANKKPLKPLLKPSPVTTPVNPFYGLRK